VGDALCAEATAFGVYKLCGGTRIRQPASCGQIIEQRIQIDGLHLLKIILDLYMRQQLAAQLGAAIFTASQILQGSRAQT
jgi:hypothetical protein